MTTRTLKPKPTLTMENTGPDILELLFPPPEAAYFKDNGARVNKNRFKCLIKGRENK